MIVVTRELTKLYETVVRGPLGTIDIGDARGEYVFVLAGAPVEQVTIDDETIRDALRVEFAGGASTRDASAAVAARFDRPKRDVYALAVALGSSGPVPARTEPGDE